MEKSILQTLLQKNKLPLPTYLTAKVGGEPHTPEWQCTLTVQGHSPIVSKVVVGSKALAEIDAAIKGKNYFDKFFEKQERLKVEQARAGYLNCKEISSSKKRTLILIDESTVPGFFDVIVKHLTLHPKLTIKIIRAVDTVKPHSSVNVEVEVKPLRLISSYMGMIVAYHLTNCSFDEYFIVTADSCGGAIAQLVEMKGTPWSDVPQNARWIRSSEEVITG